MKYLPDFLFYSKLIAIFAAEFQVLLREGVRFNGSNLVKRAVVILSCKEIWKISIIRDSWQYAHAWD